MTLGETFPNYFVKHLSGSNDTISKYLEMVLAITGLEGAFVGDEEISDVTLEFWNLLVETISTAPYLSIANHSNASEGDLVTDPLTGKPIVLNTGSGGMDSKIVGAKSVNVTAQAEDARKLEEAELILDRAKMIYVQVVKVICRKMEFPDDSEWQTYNNGELLNMFFFLIWIYSSSNHLMTLQICENDFEAIDATAPILYSASTTSSACQVSNILFPLYLTKFKN